MNANLTSALDSRLLALADDELILAHRDSEWTGHAPMIEEDIALANIAQDELGHATLWYAILCDLRKQPDEHTDQLVYFRDAADWRNAQLLELPIGDWAFTMLRQFLFDQFEWVLLPALTKSSHTAVTQAAAKVLREEIYHTRHSTAWVRRLGQGTAESHRRMQTALDVQWPLANQLFVPMLGDEALVAAGIWPDMAPLQQQWLAKVGEMLAECGLIAPASAATRVSRASHTEHLTALLADMQSVARLDPQADW
ncbi:MAG: 1,2-phenylacetyl-CoA epoxidase subunit PaaC [Chloroflexota bacterium]|jgi:ring-1,2-phenylacetyl-CoA epoxidase subunit PaaC|nr:phenylacetate-CoA oxygenase subunit PaaC [Chloroflexota bacterium]